MIDVRFYAAVLLRRLPIFLLISLTAVVLSIYVAIKLPARYESSSQLLVESAQISDQLVSSTITVRAEQQLQIFQQRLMTRANLLEIARKFRVYPELDTLSADRIVQKMRKDTSIGLQSGRDRATVMILRFEADTPQIAAGVLNEFVTLILNENSEFRKSRAADTLEFFQNEVNRLNKELEAQSSKILVFQTDNKDALPSTMAYRLSRQSQLTEQIAANNRQIASLEDQKRQITQLYEASGVSAAAAPKSADETELEGLRRELSQALLVYTPENPKVKMLQARVDALEAVIGKESKTLGTPASRSKAMFDMQLETLDKQIEGYKAETEGLRSELVILVDTIERTPGNEIALDSLDREYKILESQYNAAVSRLNTAATGERIEVLSKGERVTVVEQPTLPDEPSKPNRRLIAAAGSAMGVALAISLIVLLEVLNNTIRRPEDLTRAFEISPLAVLPVVRTPSDRMMATAMSASFVAAVVLGVPLVLLLVHTYYLPLDLLASKVMAKFGI